MQHLIDGSLLKIHVTTFLSLAGRNVRRFDFVRTAEEVSELLSEATPTAQSCVLCEPE